MIDVRALVGMSVKALGREGRVIRVSLPWVTIAWNHPRQLDPDLESYNRSDQSLFDIEALTLDQGWVPLAVLLGSKKLKRSHV